MHVFETSIIGARRKMIDWSVIITKYNLKHDTNYKTPKDLLCNLYLQQGSSEKVGDQLIISCSTIKKKMKLLGLKIKRKGWPNDTPLKNQILKYDKIHFENISITEIAKELKASKQGIRNNFKLLGYKFGKGKK